MSETFDDQVSYISQGSHAYSTPSAILRVAEYFNSLKQRRESIILKKKQNSQRKGENKSEESEKKTGGDTSGKTIHSISSEHSSIASHFRPRKRQHGTLTLKLNDSESTLSAGVGGMAERTERSTSQSESTHNHPFNKLISKIFRSRKEPLSEKAPPQKHSSENNNTTGTSHSFKLFGSFNTEKRSSQKLIDAINLQKDDSNTDNSERYTSFGPHKPYMNRNFSPVKSFKNDLGDRDKIPTSSTAFSRLCFNSDPLKTVFDKISDRKDNTEFHETQTLTNPNFSTLRNSPRPKSNGSLDLIINKVIDIQNQDSTESANLENKIFSPNTHRPSLVDVPSIDRLNSCASEELPSGSADTNNPKPTMNSGSVGRNSPTKSKENHPQPRLSARLSKVFGSASSDAISPNDSELFTASSHSNFSEKLNAIKERLHKKPKSNIANGLTKRGSFHVRFLSPRLSSIRLFRSEEALAKPAEAPPRPPSLPDSRTLTKLDIITDDEDGESLDMKLFTNTTTVNSTRLDDQASIDMGDTVKLKELYGTPRADYLASIGPIADPRAQRDTPDEALISNKYLDYIES